MKYIWILAAILLIGCEDKKAEKEIVICSGFTFNLERNDWEKARQKMHFLSMKAGLHFVDESDSASNEIAYLQTRIKTNYFGYEYALTTDRYWSDKPTKASFRFYSSQANYCKGNNSFYEDAKKSFAQEWAITEFNYVRSIKQ